MRKVINLVCAFMVIIFCTSASEVHKFYVSKTTIELNGRTGMYEITCKIFTDDLEKAIGTTGENPVRLGSEREASDADSRIENYLKQHLKISLNGIPVEPRYVGKEAETDLTYCYLELYGTTDFSTMEVVNSILFEHFTDQQNIVDLVAHGKTRTAVLIQNAQSHVFNP